MNRPLPPTPRWLATLVLGLLAGQMALLWVQGGLLNRQHQDLVAIREEIQALSELVEDTLVAPEDESGMLPMAKPGAPRKPRPRRVSVVLEEPEPSTRELEASRESARKAVDPARGAQQNLSVEEQARKAEAAAQAGRSRSRGQAWLLAALAAGILALAARVWLRRRG